MRYHEARDLAIQGRLAEAVAIYSELTSELDDASFRAVVENDLAVCECLRGDVVAARAGLEYATDLDPNCQLAHDNLKLLDDGHAGPVDGLQDAIAGGLRNPSKTKIAVVSLLFNWPSSAGGNVHTMELAEQLGLAGFDSRHFYVCCDQWGIGRVTADLPYPSHPVVITGPMTATGVRRQIRESIDEFKPDFVIITDSWNFKPHLAKAVAAYPFVMRLQAMELVCPLNNLRLLPDVSQCSLCQLANHDECAVCRFARGALGDLHQMERGLSEVGTPEYESLLRWSLLNAHSVLVVNPLTQSLLQPFCRDVQVVPSGFSGAL